MRRSAARRETLRVVLGHNGLPKNGLLTWGINYLTPLALKVILGRGRHTSPPGAFIPSIPARNRPSAKWRGGPAAWAAWTHSTPPTAVPSFVPGGSVEVSQRQPTFSQMGHGRPKVARISLVRRYFMAGYVNVRWVSSNFGFHALARRRGRRRVCGTIYGEHIAAARPLKLCGGEA